MSEAMISAGMQPLSRPVDIWSELGIESYEVEDQESGAYRIEVRRSAIDLATPVEAELVLIWNEGESNEQILVVPLRFEGEQTLFSWTITGRELAEAAPLASTAMEVL